MDSWWCGGTEERYADQISRTLMRKHDLKIKNNSAWQARGNHFSTGGQGQKIMCFSCNMTR